MVMVSAMVALLAVASATPVTVEIVTSGHIETPADRYRVSGSLLACAATQAAADADLAREVAAVERAMAALGATKASAATTFSLAGMMTSMMSSRTASECNKSSLDDLVAAASDEKDDAKPAAKTADLVGSSASLTFDAPNRAAAAKAIAALKAADAKPSDKTVPVLIDDTAAKRAAKQQALTKARAEAAAYAGPLGFGNATLIKISERQDLGSVDFVGQMFRSIGLPGATPPDKVVTDVTLTAEFRLDGR